MRTLTESERQLIRDSGLFDSAWYAEKYPDVAATGLDPLDHFLRLGIYMDREPGPLFSNEHYLSLSRSAGRSNFPIVNYLTHGWRENVNPHPSFTTAWYLAAYPDVQAQNIEPFKHFIEFGSKEGRNPSSRFQSNTYLRLNQDVNSFPGGAGLHYFLYGKKENRLTNWLDRYVEVEYGREHRIPISCLLDLLLNGSELSSRPDSREAKLNAMIARLRAAPPSSQAAQKSGSRVSIIIPVYNQVFHTLACLISLFESAPKVCFEVIIADDCSTDETATILAKFSDRIRIVRTPGNLGFLKNCNHAAKAAKGEFVVFLNNDMVLLPDWLDSLVATISQDSECGMVGSKLLNLDGTLQEAGGIFWNDGSAWNYGRGQNPMAPEFNYKKEVDYCSGASICLRKEVWDAVGGFDEIYAPAYCEESDLAFRLRARGLKTIYQPRSVGIHLEGVSCGTDTAQGIKAYQVENQKKLLARWSEVLKNEHFENGTNVIFARDRSNKKKRVLVVDACTPTPDQDAGSLTCLNTMLLFQHLNFHVMFLPMSNLMAFGKYTRFLQSHGIEALYFSCKDELCDWFRSNASSFDLVFVFRPHTYADLESFLKKYCSRCPVVFHTVDLHFLRLERQASLTNDILVAQQAEETKLLELRLIEEADATIVHSIAERDLLKSIVPISKVHTFPLILDVANRIPSDFNRRDIVFVGGFQHSPNVDAVYFFVSEVMPLLREKLPGIRFHIAGSNPPIQVRELETNDVLVHGYVEHLSPFLDSMRVSVAPLRYGAGIKGKIGTAMAAGLPVVATSIAAEGMSLQDGIDILLADTAEAISEAIIKLTTDTPLWNRISDASLASANKLWGPEAGLRHLHQIIGNLVDGVKSVNFPPSLYRDGLS